MRTLDGARVVVTGAGGTIGRALSVALRDAGAQVVGLDRTVPPDAPVPILTCDLTDEAAVRDAVRAALDRLGGLDLLVNNAGVGGPAPAELPPDATVRRQLEVNLIAAWSTTAAAIPALEEARGRVVFIASRMAVLPLPLAAAYGVSKRAVVAYADALRLEVGTHVGVSVVYPSMIASPIHDSTAAAGLSLDGVSRYEPVEGVVRAVVRAATVRRPPANLATTGRGRLELAIARHLPGVARWMVNRTVARRLAAGSFDRADLAAGLRRRAGR
ncbi:SDR family NAD(P)-dependent oxidoreductase [Asanoa sp. NPDC050611]|uniref:SDR family NAD(P)-dependent oxidoreductase n=1 Tax=Asanoa sp. NPDC050611 TaxID=3157098 RepID=UPI0033C208D6